MKTKFIVILTLGLFLFGAGMAMAANPTVFINGEELVTDSAAYVENDTPMVPLRAVFEALNQEVAWNAEDRSVTSGNILLQIDNKVATVNGESVTLDVAPTIVNDRTFVPLNFVAASLDKEVLWDAALLRADIKDKPVDEITPEDESAPIDEGTPEDEVTPEEEVTPDEEETFEDEGTAGDNGTAEDEGTSDNDDGEDNGTPENGDDEDVTVVE